MQISTIDVHTTTNALNALPIRMKQRPNTISAALFLVILVPAIVALFIPVFALISMAITDPAALSAISGNAGSALLVTLGLGIWATMMGIPACRFFAQLGAMREIEITNGTVHVKDRSLTHKSEWSLPLSEFSGLKHNIRTTTSGSRHELVLVHPQRSKCVLIHMAPAITDIETSIIARLLTQPVIDPEFQNDVTAQKLGHDVLAPTGSEIGEPAKQLTNIAA